MSDKTEYSRLLIKRATETGVIPTIPTGTTLDTFTTTDIFKGELFLNSTDDNLWVRTENGILQILDSGFTSSNSVTGFTYDDSNNLTIHNKGGDTYTANISTMTGLTVNGSFSATTLYGDGSGLTNINTGDIYVTGFTYDDANKLTIVSNSGASLNTYINVMTGLTINGNTNPFQINGTNSKFYYDPTSVGGRFNLSGNTGIPRFDVSIAGYGTRLATGGSVGLRWWNDGTYPGYGKVGDMFMYAGNEAYGLNIINPPGTNQLTRPTEDYIRFYAGQQATGTADIHIQGSGATRGYVGINTETPTDPLTVNGKTKTTNLQVTNGATNGYVLTSDGSGNATWQASTATFSGGSGNCISELYTSSIIGCSPLSIYSDQKISGYTTSGSYKAIDLNSGGDRLKRTITKSSGEYSELDQQLDRLTYTVDDTSGGLFTSTQKINYFELNTTNTTSNDTGFVRYTDGTGIEVGMTDSTSTDYKLELNKVENKLHTTDTLGNTSYVKNFLTGNNIGTENTNTQVNISTDLTGSIINYQDTSSQSYLNVNANNVVSYSTDSLGNYSQRATNQNSVFDTSYDQYSNLGTSLLKANQFQVKLYDPTTSAFTSRIYSENNVGQGQTYMYGLDAVNNRQDSVYLDPAGLGAGTQFISQDLITTGYAQQAFNPTSISMKVDDTINSRGLTMNPGSITVNGGQIDYGADYSSNYGDRSLVDKGYVDSQITNSQFTGGTVTGATQFTNGLSASTISGGTFYGDGSGLTNVSATATKFSVTCRNQSGSNMYKGMIVIVSGSTGNLPTIRLAQANTEATSSRTFGVLEQDINNNASGSVLVIGSIQTLDTRTSAPNPFTTDTLVDGDAVYLSPTNAGYITNVKPSSPNHLVYIGRVIRTSPTNGYIQYQIQNGYELNEIHDVSISGVSNLDILQYDSSTSLWKNTNSPKFTTISAATYQNLPVDVRVTGATYNNSNTFIFTNNTGGTFNVGFNTVSGLTSTGTISSSVISATTYQNLPVDPDTFTTGLTYSNNTLTLSQNQGQPNLTASINTMTGLTINGNLVVTGSTGVNWISGNTSTDMLRITQVGTGNALVVEDSANPDSTPFVINQNGNVAIGTSAGSTDKLRVNGSSSFIGSVDLSGNLTFSTNADIGTSTGIKPTNIYTTNLYGTTISATTYQNLPTDIYSTGGTYSNGTLTVRNLSLIHI